ncbi:hypothetical protein ACP275_11G064300 [Erythranthe tilingii]
MLDSDTRKENMLLESTVPEDLMASKLEYELGQDFTIEHSGGVSVRVPDSSGAMEDDVSSDGSQANKMEAQQIQDTTDMEQTAKDDSIKPCTETHEVDKMEVEKGLSLNCDREILTLLNSKDSDHADPDLMPNEASLSSHVCHANVIVEPDSSGAMGDVSSDESKKKKKKSQKMAKHIQDTTDMEQITIDDSIRPCTESDKSDKNEEEKGLSLNCDREIITPLEGNASDCPDPDLVPKEASLAPHVCHTNAIVEPDSTGLIGDVSSEGSKKKKKKPDKTGEQIQDTTDMEQTAKDDSIQPCTETHKADDEEEEKGVSLNCDREIITPSNSKASGHPDLDLVPKEATFLARVCHVNAIVEPDSSGAMGDVSSDGSRKKKKKGHKTAKQIQDTTDMEQITNDDSIQPCTESHKADEKEEEKGLSVNCDREITTPLNSKASDCAGPDLVPKEACFSPRVRHANAIVELDSSGVMGDVSSDGRKKKKKKAQKTAKQIQDTTNMEQITNDDSIQPCAESHKADEKEEEKGLPVNCDREIITASNSKASDHADPDLVPKEACFSPRVLHANAIVEPDSSGAMGDVYSDRNKRMKKRSQKAAKKPRDTTDMEQTAKDDSTKPCSDTHKVDKSEEEKGLCINLDHETVMPSNSKASDYADQDLAPEESTFSTQFGDANAIVQPEISSGGRKKKTKRKGKKSANSNIEKSGIEQTENGGIGSSELLCAPTDPIPEETHKEESILYHKEMDVNMALLDGSTQDANEEVKGADKKEAEFFISTQTKQALDGVDTGNKTVEEKTQLSAAHAHFPAVVEFTDVEKDIKNSEGKIEKSKRRKKRKHTGLDVQENLPSKDQKVDIEALTTEENLNGFVNSEQKGGHEASLQVLSNKGEEKLEEIRTAPVITDDPAKTSENGGVGINFKEYFLPGQNKEITDSGDKTEEIRTSKNIRDDVLPSVGVSTDLQNSIKKTKSKRSEKKTRVTKDSGSRQGDSSQNRAFDEVISKSSKRSSKSRVNEKNPSLDKSSSKKTETFHERRGNNRLHSSLNVTDKLVMKTSKKKSLLTIPGAIFQDNSGESSADDNGTVHLKGSIASPPDSSSESDNAIEKGSNDVEGRSTGRKNISEVDISASKNMTMDLILRSSKRFKKAKLNAYDNGYDDSENLEEVQEEGKAADLGLSK